MIPHEMASKIDYLGTDQAAQNVFKFNGKGFVVHGGITCSDTQYEAQLEVTVDGVVDKVMVLCSDYRKRTDALSTSSSPEAPSGAASLRATA